MRNGGDYSFSPNGFLSHGVGGGGGWNWPSSVLRDQSEFKLEWGVEEK